MQHGYYSERYSVVYLIVAKTVYLIVAKAVHLESFHHMHSYCNYILRRMLIRFTVVII